MGLNFDMLRSRSYDRAYYEEHRAAGLDYAVYGDWHRQYGRWLAESLGLAGKRVLDVGCACGTIAMGLAEAGAAVNGIDLCEPMVCLGRGLFPAVTLDVCDSANLHLFGADTFDLVHANRTLEHFRPALAPHIVAEFRRVLKPGGLLYTVHDTAEQFEREGRRADDVNGEHGGDPTHVCIRPKAWWSALFDAEGFANDLSSSGRLSGHPLSFTARYGWDWWLLRKPL